MRIEKLLFLICIGVFAYADNVNNIIASNAILDSRDKEQVLSTEKLGNQTVTKPQMVGKSEFSNLNAIDTDSNDINQLNRKLQLEKIAAEIKKLKNNSSSKINNREVMDNAQTTVSGVAINEDGKKIAWLQFADGGSLMVNVGSRVGDYIVSNITMTGVILNNTDSHIKHLKKIFLKRVYTANINNKKANNISSSGSTFFSPSPILTGANSSDDGIPSILPMRSKY